MKRVIAIFTLICTILASSSTFTYAKENEEPNGMSWQVETEIPIISCSLIKNKAVEHDEITW